MTNDKKQDNTPPEAGNRADGARETPAVQPLNDEDTPLVDEEGELLPGPVEQLEIEIADLKDRYLRQVAEMDNLRKRTERERSDIKKYAISEFARDILPLSDNFQRAIDAVPAEAAEQDEALNSFLEGVKMNERELQKVLERHGVTQIDPKGEKFDPNRHQAVQQVDNPELPNNTVCDVYQVGYVIADRVLRPAVVAVAKGGPKTAAPANEQEKEPPLTLPETDTGAAGASASASAGTENTSAGNDPGPANEGDPDFSAGAPGSNVDKSA